MRSLRSPLSFDQKVLMGFLAGAVLLVVVLFLASLSVQQVRVTSARAHQTQEARLKLELIGQTLLDMETGKQGYMLTSRDEYAEPYFTGQRRLAKELAAIEPLLADNPAQSQNLAQLKRLLEKRQAQLAHVMNLHKTQGFEAGLAFMLTNQGHFTMEAIRALLDRMSTQELRVLEVHTASERESLRRNFFFSTLLSVSTLGLLLVIYLLIRREIATRARAAQLLDQVNASLEARVKESTRDLSTSNAALIEEIAQRREAQAALQKERELLEARVQERTAELVAASESKSRFLSAASHDLRQPLHSLMLLNATLRGQTLGDTARDIVEAQRQSLESMSRLVHALLNISMLESGVVQPQVRDFPLNQIVKSLRAEFAPLAQAKGLQLQLDLPDEMVCSDPTLFTEVIQNLLGNAIRYTECGGVRVRARRDVSAVRIEVTDTGPGIPADQLELIFEEFQQVRTRGRTREGFGLGLSIVRHLVKLLGIELKVQSTVGAGTTFTLDLPPGSEASRRIEKREVSKPTEHSSGRILLIDDEAPVRNATALFLGIEGHHVFCAGSPEEALARFREMGQLPDVIVSDYQLGTPITGADLIEQLRATAQSSIPAVVLSGDTLRVTRRCASIENCKIFHKPVDAEELAQHVRVMLGSRLAQPS